MMKPLVATIAMIVLLPILASAEPRPKSEPPDPIVGSWIWRDGHFVTVKPDGTAISRKGPRATWKYLNNKEVNRKYQIIWDGGLFIDAIVASVDGKTLNAKDQNGVKFVIRRAPDEGRIDPK